MSLGIAIGDETLDLRPGTVLEWERDNPFLQFGEELKGSHTWPFDVPATDRNIRLTRYVALPQARVDVKGQDVTILDDNQHSIGKLKVEQVQHNLNRAEDSTLSCYVLSEWSYFFQEIKGLRLREVALGGDRIFPFTTLDRNGGGFWGHIHQVLDAPAGYRSSGYDYAFYPVINMGMEDSGGDIMNYVEYTGGQLQFRLLGTAGRENRIVPFPYLSYLVEQVVKHIGWNITGDILNDPEFRKITLIDCTPIKWGLFQGMYQQTFSEVSFNLRDHVADITLVQFFLWLKNRFGWWFDVDRKTRTIHIKPLKLTALARVKEMTPYASPLLPKKINPDTKGYALRNQFMGIFNDGAISLSGVKYQGLVASVAALNATYPPSESRYTHAYLVVSENTYYVCLLNDAGAFQWEVFAPNIGDVVPEGDNQDISSAAVAVPSEKYNGYFDFIPRADMQGDPQALYMAVYHGQRANRSGQPIPFATSGIYDSTGIQVGTWSICFSCFRYDGTDVGLYPLAWQPFLQTLQTREELVTTLSLDRVQYDDLQFFDVVSIQNTHMYIKKIKTRIPYDGSVDIEALRI